MSMKKQSRTPIRNKGIRIIKEKRSLQKKEDPALSDPLKEELLRFIEYHSAKRFSKNLRSMLLEFLMDDSAIESNYLKDLLYDLEGLFDLLEVIQSEFSNEINH